MDEKGQLSESIPYDVLAAHIWWQETGTAWNASTGAKGTFLGIHDGAAYALLYNGILHDRSVNGGNVLTRQTLSVIKDDLGGADYNKLVVYGEACRLGDSKLVAEKIEFRPHWWSRKDGLVAMAMPQKDDTIEAIKRLDACRCLRALLQRPATQTRLRLGRYLRVRRW